ncbi:hypothetical protein MKEN_00351000 [Mycena kentingensis (nom. inval.)]|nr:hypothetical protein MKEN_00351000 [Mycena kentingensis (nom. inval.)]
MSSILGFVNRLRSIVNPPEAKPAADIKPLKFGILGAANIAPEALIKPAKSHPEVVVYGIAARSKDRATAYAKTHGIEKVYASYQEMLDDPAIDCVYNPLPNGLHFEWTAKALKAGKHVLLEKPSTNTAEETQKLFELAEERNLVLLEAFHYRFHPAVIRAKEIVDSGELGAVKSTRTALAVPAGLIKPDDIRFDHSIGGGALMDMGSYSVNSMRYFTGHEPTSVTSVAQELSTSRLPKSELVDRKTTATLALPGGITSTIHCDLRTPPTLGVIPKWVDMSATIECDKGTLLFNNYLMPTIWHAITVKPQGGKQRVEKRYTFPDLGQPWWTTYRYQLEAFVNKVQGRPVHAWVSKEDSIANIAVIETVYAKSGLGSRPKSESRQHIASVQDRHMHHSQPSVGTTGSSSSLTDWDDQPVPSKVAALSPSTSSTFDASLATCVQFQLSSDNISSYFVDKSLLLDGLPSEFRGLLLRPPQFGKSAIISILSRFYDKHQNPHVWDNLSLFKQGLNATASRGRHLCLLLSLANVFVSPEGKLCQVSLCATISRAVFHFGEKYAVELGLSDVRTALAGPVADWADGQPDTLLLFSNLWNAVKTSGYMLFVGVDDYDTPLVSATCLSSSELWHNTDEIGGQMDSLFWTPLASGLEVISKLLVTGLRPIRTWSQLPHLCALGLVELPVLDEQCGLTRGEALALAAKSGISLDAQILGGEHIFGNSRPLLNPREIINDVRQRMSQVIPRPPDPLRLYASVLDCLDVDADDGRLTINTLIALVANTTTNPAAWSGPLVRVVGESCLFDYGALARNQAGDLRIASAAVLDKLHMVIDDVVAERFNLLEQLGIALGAILADEGFSLLGILFEAVLRRQMEHSLGRGSFLEPTMHGVFELIMRHKYSAFRERFDPLVLQPRCRVEERLNGRVWMLKTISLRSLFAAQSSGAEVGPSLDTLNTFYQQLQTEDIDSVLARSYRSTNGQLSRVADKLSAELGATVVLAIGGAHVLIKH